MEHFNKSLGSMEYKSVVPIKNLMKGSLYYTMIHKPCGKCIIINNHIKYLENSKRLDLKAYGQLYIELIEFEIFFKI